LARIRARIESYQKQYPRLAHDHLAILDMDDAAFNQMFGPDAALKFNTEAAWLGHEAAQPA
jgi:hypothetical protein